LPRRPAYRSRPTTDYEHARQGDPEVKKSFLKRLQEDVEGDRKGWERFVVIKADAQGGMSMYPRTMPGATLLLDRHYNSLTPYRKSESNIYTPYRKTALASSGTSKLQKAT